MQAPERLHELNRGTWKRKRGAGEVRPAEFDVGNDDDAMNGTRAACRAWCGLVRDTLVRDGATTTEAVPMTFMHSGHHIVGTHGDDFVAAGSQQGLDSLKNFVEKCRTKPLGRTGPNCSKQSGKFLRRTLWFADGAFWWKPHARHVQGCIEELGLAGGKAPSTLGAKDTLKNFAEAEDSLSEVESESFQRLDCKIPHHSKGDPTIQFELAMVMSDMYKPSVGAMAGLMWVMRNCIDRPTLSSTDHQQKLAVHANADHASDDTTRKKHVVLPQKLGALLDRKSVSTPSNCCFAIG